MIFVLLYLVLSSYISFIFAIPAQTDSDLVQIIPATNDSVIALENPQILQCDSRYGVHLDILDCRNAISQMKTGTEQVTVEDRDDILPGDDATLPLPYRLMGSKYPRCLRPHSSLVFSLENDSHENADSANCYIQPVLMPGFASGRVSLDQLKAAASVILGQCAFGPNSGGILKNIGTRQEHSQSRVMH